MRISSGHARTTPSPAILRVASMPILLPAPQYGLAWSSTSTGPSAMTMSRRGSTLAPTWNRTSCSSCTSTSSSTITTNFVNIICPAPQTELITLRACSGYSLRILIKAQLWNAPNIGRW